MPSVTTARLRSELQSLYVPPFGAPATWAKMRQALDELEAVGVRRSSDLTPTAVGRWVLAHPGRSLATAKTLLSSIRRVASYCVLGGYLKASPFAFRPFKDWLRDLDDDQVDEAPPARHHPIADLCRVVATLRAEAPASWENHRLYALAATVALTGARAREAQCAKVADFDLAARLWSIRPNERRRLKTRAARRRVPLPPELGEVLAAWLPVAGSAWAFPGSRRSSPWEGGAPGRKPLDRLKAAGARCGVEGLTFLSLRHSYITHSEGPWRVPDLATRRVAGHTSKRTTDGYRGFDAANLVAAVESITLGLASPARAG